MTGFIHRIARYVASVMPVRSRATGVRRLTPLLAAATVALGMLFVAAPAVAAPNLEVDLSHTPTTMPRNDEELSYLINVKNTAPPTTTPAVGDTFGCKTGNWSPGSFSGVAPTFSYEWRRNGAVIAGATESTYTAVGADEGKALQCVVIGTNVNAKTKFASLNPYVIGVGPGSGPPMSENPKANESRPTIAGTGTGLRTCTPPANWTPRAPESPATTYE
jgi:hypothetical protein